jgi:hypothetical protein
MKPIEQSRYEAGELIKKNPPHFHNRNKRLVYELACSSGVPFEGVIWYSRWPEEQPPAEIPAQRQFTVRLGAFDYAAPADPAVVDWYLNFADPHLFFAYGSGLMAQDELQVAEHPILAALREELVASGRLPVTVDENGRPSPVTVWGAQRRCAVETMPNVIPEYPSGLYPSGLYGNAFARASEEQIRAGVKPLLPATLSNILAIAAPAGGSGAYTEAEIQFILNTAYSGFLAARCESERLAGAHAHTVIHTGFWGCGAFGGNRALMTILQAFAGDLAGVDIVFWVLDRPGFQLASEVYATYARLRESASTTPQLVQLLLQQGYSWGVSNGT